MIDRRMLLGGIAAASATMASAARAQEDRVRGSWSGALSVGSVTLRLRLEIGDGSAVLYSLDQGGAPIEGKASSLEPGDIRIDFPQIGATYRAKLVGDALEGEFNQGAPLPLRFVRGGAPAAAAAPVPMTDSSLARIREESGSPALVAGAVASGAPRFWVAGERAEGSGVAATTADLWHIGSITKSMTATLVARMVEAGRVRWDEPLPRLLPALAGDMRADYAAVTLRHLLSHRAGLIGNLPPAQLSRLAMEAADPREDRLFYARTALSTAPVGAPEQTFAYSNAGYIIAGAILEQRLGKPWEALIREHLFQPLRMARAGFGAPGRKGELLQPAGHAPDAVGKLHPIRPGDPVTDNPAAVGPAGRVHLSMGDLLTYLAAHRDRAGLLKRESWDVLHTPPFGGDYAMGWVVRPDGLIWHNGSNTFWYAEAAFDRAGGKAAAAVSNDGRLGRSQPAVGRALRSALAAV